MSPWRTWKCADRVTSPTCARGYSPTVIAHEIPNLVDGKRVPAAPGQLDKLRPPTARVCAASRGRRTRTSLLRSPPRARLNPRPSTPVERGEILREPGRGPRARRDDAAEIVAAETGKPLELALGETDAAVEMGSSSPARVGALRPHDDREHASSHCSHRAAAARGCGPDHELQHAAAPEPRVEDLPRDLLRQRSGGEPSEHVPASAHFFAELALESGVPPGVLNVVHGLGSEVGAALVEHEDVDLVSFTGSAATGRRINERPDGGWPRCASSWEARTRSSSATTRISRMRCAGRRVGVSNAGQRCAAASRIVVFDVIYEDFRDRLIAGTGELEPEPVISEAALARMLDAIEKARHGRSGGVDGRGTARASGFHLAPTVLEGASPDHEISRTELFGPVTLLYRVSAARRGHTCSSTTRRTPSQLPSTPRACTGRSALRRRSRPASSSTGGPTGRPHMGFGGVKSSGTGWREAGIEASTCIRTGKS